MIDTKEIRIGVFINDHEGNPFQVKAIDFDYNDDNFPPVFYVNHKPLHTCTEIPLTPEWLERFGFEDDFYNLSGSAWLKWIKEDNVVLLEDDWGNWICEVSYVHSLQNLVFLIEGKELELKK